eukprot:6192846-Pleurochrysis_carterae.AAC.1
MDFRASASAGAIINAHIRHRRPALYAVARAALAAFPARRRRRAPCLSHHTLHSAAGRHA